MTIYEHRTSMLTVAGAISTTSLRVTGGICRQVLVVARTTTTVFRVNLVDENSLTRRNYAFHTGELNDECAFPMTGRYTLNITNASPNDTFDIVVAVQEH